MNLKNTIKHKLIDVRFSYRNYVAFKKREGSKYITFIGFVIHYAIVMEWYSKTIGKAICFVLHAHKPAIYELGAEKIGDTYEPIYMKYCGRCGKTL